MLCGAVCASFFLLLWFFLSPSRSASCIVFQCRNNTKNIYYFLKLPLSPGPSSVTPSDLYGVDSHLALCQECKNQPGSRGSQQAALGSGPT